MTKPRDIDATDVPFCAFSFASDEQAEQHHSFMYMPVYVNNVHISALIDTGSSVNIMSRDVYDSIPNSCKLPIDQSTCSEVLLANNAKLVIDGTAKVSVRINGDIHDVVFHIFASCTHPIILGMDYLRKNKVVLDFSKFDVHTSKCKDVKITCTKTFVIPPESEIIVTGMASSPVVFGSQGICSNVTHLNRKGVIVAKSLCTFPRDGTVPVKLFNTTKSSVRIVRGKPIAMCELLDGTTVSFCTNLNGLIDAPLVNNVQTHVPATLPETKDTVHSSISCDTEFIHAFDNLNHLSEHEHSELCNLLCANSDLFVTARNPSLGFTELVKHTITLKSDFKPKHQRPYRLPPDKREVLRHHIDELLAQGIISPISEREDLPITSPIVLVTKRCKKPNSSGKLTREDSLSQYRFCCDFRYLNTQTQEFRYAIPNLQELTESFSGFTPQYFTSIDLSSGFFQMGLSHESKRLTAFNTCFGTYQFERLPMGLSTAPNSFQLLMDKVLNGLTFKSCLCYLDDVLVVSGSFEQHLADLAEVLERFRFAGLKLNPKKCSFAQRSCTFLGHDISENGISPPQDRIQAVMNLPDPKDASGLRRVMGLFNWFRKYIPNFSSVASPLNDLLKKDSNFVWRKEHSRTLETLKSLLASSPVLAFPDFSCQFRIAVDTSARGIGYMLYQRGDDESVNVIRFGSKSLTKWQRSYGPTKLELLGMVVAVLDCADYVRGSRFVVECDHQALKPLFAKQLKGAIYERWLAILQQFQIDIEYKPAAEMVVADTLSREVCEDTDDNFSSPSEDDPFFPYVTEPVGDVRFPEGRTLKELIEQPRGLPETHFVDTLRTNDCRVDDGYDADTDDHDLFVPKKTHSYRSRLPVPKPSVALPVKPLSTVPTRCVANNRR